MGEELARRYLCGRCFTQVPSDLQRSPLTLRDLDGFPRVLSLILYPIVLAVTPLGGRDQVGHVDAEPAAQRRYRRE